MKQTIAIQVNGEYTSETTHLVTLIVTNDFIPECDHLEVKVSEEGIIIERWDSTNARFVRAYCVVFADDFKDPQDVYADEADGDADSVTAQGAPVVAVPESESDVLARLAFDLPQGTDDQG